MKRGIAKIRISAAATSRNAETSIAEIRPGFYVLDAEETHAVRLVQHGVAHRLLHGLGAAGGPTRIDAIRNTATAASQITSSRLRCFVMGWRGFFSFCFFKTAPPPLRWPALPARPPRSGAARYRPGGAAADPQCQHCQYHPFCWIRSGFSAWIFRQKAGLIITRPHFRRNRRILFLTGC